MSSPFHALMFGWLWRLRPRVQRSGELLKIYLLCYVLFRFLVQVVRGLTLYPFAVVDYRPARYFILAVA